MAEDFQEGKEETAVLKRWGFPIYETNPSVGAFPVRIKRSNMKAELSVYMVAPSSGDVIGRGAFGFVEEKQVDGEEFVKIYLDGVRKYGEVKKAGALLFEFVYWELSGKDAKDKDTVVLNYLLANRWKQDLTEHTYFRCNVRFMFNDDRLILGKSYRRRRPQEMMQEELPLLEGMRALPAPTDRQT